MDQKHILRQMTEFSRTAFNNTFSTLVLLQDQFERVTQTAMTQANWLPEEGRKAITEWTDAYKAGRDNLKKYADESYKKMEEFFAG
jgi:hypothetical protein